MTKKPDIVARHVGLLECWNLAPTGEPRVRVLVEPNCACMFVFLPNYPCPRSEEVYFLDDLTSWSSGEPDRLKIVAVQKQAAGRRPRTSVTRRDSMQEGAGWLFSNSRGQWGDERRPRAFSRLELMWPEGGLYGG